MAKAARQGSEELYYLKIALGMLNDSLPPQEKKFTTKEFSCLTPELMQRMFICMLQNIFEDFQPQPQYQPFSNLNEASINSRITYNTSIDQIYWKAKACFPPNSSILDYGVLMAPGCDMKKARQAIAYMVAFTLCCDQTYERFGSVYGQLSAENHEKTDLCAEIEKTKEMIAIKTQEIKDAKQEIPLLEAKVEDLKNIFQSIEQENSDLNRKIAKDKIKYEESQAFNKGLELEITDLGKENDIIKCQIVKSPREIKQAYEEQCLKLKTVHARRNDLGEQLKNSVGEDQLMYDVIEIAHNCIITFEDLIQKMNESANDATLCNDMRTQINIINKKTRDIQKQHQEVKELVEKCGHSYTERKLILEPDMKEKKLLSQQLINQMQSAYRNESELVSCNSSLKSDLQTLRSVIENLRAQVKDMEIWCLKTLQEAKEKAITQKIQFSNDLNSFFEKL